jgi:hypothetical protein
LASIKKSSIFFPFFIASTSQRGLAPLPAQVSPDGPRYVEPHHELDQVQQVADDREGNSHADPDRHGGKPFIDLISQLHQSLIVHVIFYISSVVERTIGGKNKLPAMLRVNAALFEMLTQRIAVVVLFV